MMSGQTGALDREIATFNEKLSSLSGDEGRYVVIADQNIIGVFDTYSDALEAGYKARGLETFLVKQINTIEMVANFSRSFTAA